MLKFYLFLVSFSGVNPSKMFRKGFAKVSQTAKFRETLCAKVLKNTQKHPIFKNIFWHKNTTKPLKIHNN